MVQYTRHSQCHPQTLRFLGDPHPPPCPTLQPRHAEDRGPKTACCPTRARRGPGEDRQRRAAEKASELSQPSMTWGW